MKKFNALLSCALGAAMLCGCANVGKSTLLATPAQPSAFTYTDSDTDNFQTISSGVNAFSARFAEAVYAEYEGDANFAVAPVSVYMALALASVCAAGDTRAQLLSALGTTEEELAANFAYLYSSLNRSYTGGQIAAANSIWMQEGPDFIEACLKALAGEYFCYPYAADFRGDNINANAALRHFISEATRGLIDRDFQLSTDTCFALVNTLYLKDVWNLDGLDLPYTDNEVTFTRADGSEVLKSFLRGYYNYGAVQRGENYSTFYTVTANGYRIKFILPDDGTPLSDVFTQEIISAVHSITDYGGVNDELKERYYTRCLFPEFEAEYDEDVKGVLSDTFGIEDFFVGGECNISSLLAGSVDDRGYPVYCSRVQHAAKLSVNKEGIEGAAVTIVANEGSSAGVDEYEHIYYDFVVDRDFGYIVADSYGTILFTGAVNNI